MTKISLRSLTPDSIVKLRHSWQRWQQDRGEARAYRATAGRIVAGPFAGLRFVDDADGIPLAPKLLGTYELELFDVLDEIVHAGHDLIVNVGAGEGYYAVGLLSRMASARSVAFEAGERRRMLIDRLAQLNGVNDQIDVKGTATHESLQAALEGARQPVVLCDIEGGESTLLDPGRVPDLKRADILVEVHDFLDPGISKTLRERFDSSHDREIVASRDRTLDDISKTPFAGDESMVKLISERRPCRMEWFWLRARRVEIGKMS